MITCDTLDLRVRICSIVMAYAIAQSIADLVLGVPAWVPSFNLGF